MKHELPRQAVHMSGMLLALLSLYVTPWLVAAYSWMVAAGLLAYAVYFRMEKGRLMKAVERMEAQFRALLLRLEHRQSESPLFAGAFWFFFSIGLCFIVFPPLVAAAAVWMFSLGDALSTLAGKGFGKHRIVGNKTVEGSLAFLLSGMTAVIFLPLFHVILGSATATMAELLPESRPIRRLKGKGLMDDNFIAPMAAGTVMWLFSVFLWPPSMPV